MLTVSRTFTPAPHDRTGMDLEGRLEADAGDDRVEFEFTVRNAGDDAVELQFSDSQRAELVAGDGDDVVWRFSDGRAFAQMLSTERLAPGDQFEFECVWEHPPPGTFDVEAALTATDADCVATTRVSV